MQAQYFGMISEVDAQLARVWAALRGTRRVGRHGDRRHGRSRRPARRSGPGAEGRLLRVELRVLGIVRDPSLRPRRRRRRLHREHRHHADALRGDGHRRAGPVRRVAADAVPARRAAQLVARRGVLRMGLARLYIPHGDHDWPWDRRLERQNLAVRRSRDRAFVQFGDGSWRCFDLAADPTWQTEVTDPEIVMAEAAADAELAFAQPRSDDDRHAVAGRRHRPQTCATQLERRDVGGEPVEAALHAGLRLGGEVHLRHVGLVDDHLGAAVAEVGEGDGRRHPAFDVAAR